MFSFLKNKWVALTSDKRFSEILTGSTWALSGQVAATALGLVFSMVVARYYGAEVLGIVSIINSYLMLATTITVLGTNTSILRMIPEHLVKYSPTSAFKVYRKTVCLVLLVSLFSATLLFFSSDLIAEKIFSKPNLSFYFAIGSLFVVFKSLAMLNTQAIRAVRLIRVFAFMQMMPQAFNLLLLFIIRLAMPTLAAPFYAFLGSFALTGIMGAVIIEYEFQQKSRRDDRFLIVSFKEILSLSLPMLMAAAMSFVIGEISIIVLGMFRSQAEVGYYSIAVKISALTAFILSAVCSMAGSKFSELFHSDRMDELFYVAKKSAKLIFWTSVPIFLAIVILGKFILSIFFGADFIQSYPPLIILSVGQLVNSICGTTGLFMNMTGNHKAYRNIMMAGCILNIALNMLLVPKFGLLGASLAAMLSLISWNFIIILYIKIKFGKTISYFPMLN